MHLTLHLTTSCNMNCGYCYSPPRESEPMSKAIGKKAMDFGSRITSGSCGVVFFGGEPLLCKDLIYYLVEYGRHLERYRAGRFHFKITTNGVLLDEAFLEFAIRNDVLVAMSFDGIKEAHDRHRKFRDGSPTYDYLHAKLQLLIEARPYASILMVVNPDTSQYLAQSVEMLIAMRCRYLIVSLNYAADWQEDDFAALTEQLNRLADRYIEWTEQGIKFYFSPFEVKISSHVNRHCFKKEQCELGQRQISVDPRGYLYPCVQFTRAGSESSWCIGDVDKGIDESRRAEIYKQSEAEKAVCSDCAIKQRCNNSCGCLNWQSTGSINQVSPVLCRYEQILVPIADRIGEALYKKRNALFLHKHYNLAYPILSLLEDQMES